MTVEVTEEPLANLDDYTSVSIAFEVTAVFDVADGSNGADDFVLTERSLDEPYVKDYDALESPGQWSKRFDISNWGAFGARVSGRRIGGAIVAFNTPELKILERREDRAILWDLRVSPEARGLGVGTALFKAAELWSSSRGCRTLAVETQNTNVPANRFYERQGCRLAAVRRAAYPSLPDEIQLLWQKKLF